MSTASGKSVQSSSSSISSIAVNRSGGSAQDDSKGSAVEEECEYSRSAKLKSGPSMKKTTGLRQSASNERLDKAEIPSPQGGGSTVDSEEDWEVVTKSKTTKTKTSPSDRTVANAPKAKEPKNKRNEKFETAIPSNRGNCDKGKLKGRSKAAESSKVKTDSKAVASTIGEPVVLSKPPVSTTDFHMTTFSAIVSGNTVSSHAIKRVEPLPAVPEPDTPEGVDGEFAELDALLSQYVVTDSKSSEVERKLELFSDCIVQSHETGQGVATSNATPFTTEEEDGHRKMMNLVERMREVYPGLSVEQYMTLMGLCRDEIRRDRAAPHLAVPACDILERLKGASCRCEKADFGNV